MYAEDTILVSIKWELLYELYEIGFVQDLMDLDRELNVSDMDHDHHMELLDACFPSQYHTSSPAKLQFTNQGLSAPLMCQQLLHLLAMQELMLGWDSQCPPCKLLSIK